MTQFSRLEAVQSLKTKLLKWAAIQIYYYLIAADGEISEEKMECFLDFAEGTDSLFDQYKEQLIEECKNQLKKITKGKSRYAVLKEGIDLVYQDQINEIVNGLDGKSGYINADMFIRNMLSLGIFISDFACTYTNKGQAIIQYVIEKFDFDREMFLQLDKQMKEIQYGLLMCTN